MLISELNCRPTGSQPAWPRSHRFRNPAASAPTALSCAGCKPVDAAVPPSDAAPSSGWACAGLQMPPLLLLSPSRALADQWRALLLPSPTPSPAPLQPLSLAWWPPSMLLLLASLWTIAGLLAAPPQRRPRRHRRCRRTCCCSARRRSARLLPSSLRPSRSRAAAPSAGSDLADRQRKPPTAPARRTSPRPHLPGGLRARDWGRPCGRAS